MQVTGSVECSVYITYTSLEGPLRLIFIQLFLFSENSDNYVPLDFQKCYWELEALL